MKTGRAGEALRSFSVTAQANPSNGVPKVGYALAAADLGRLDTGVWAMRRALRLDPDSLHLVNGDASLRSKVEHLVQRYENSDLNRTGDGDAYFMLAALYYLLGDYEASKRWIEQANDGPTSTENLHRLIHVQADVSQSLGSPSVQAQRD